MTKSDLRTAIEESDFGPKQGQCSEINLQWEKTKPMKS